MSLQMALFHSFWWLSNMPLYKIHPLLPDHLGCLIIALGTGTGDKQRSQFLPPWHWQSGERDELEPKDQQTEWKSAPASSSRERCMMLQGLVTGDFISRLERSQGFPGSDVWTKTWRITKNYSGGKRKQPVQGPCGLRLPDRHKEPKKSHVSGERLPRGVQWGGEARR